MSEVLTLGLTEAARKTRRIIEHVSMGGVVMLLRHSKPAAVVVPLDWEEKQKKMIDYLRWEVERLGSK